MPATIEPFKIDLSQEEVDRLIRKLKDTRIPKKEIVPGAASDYGPSIEWFHRLYNKWISDFDWSKIQVHLNRHPHFLAQLDDEGRKLQIHFTHVKSPCPDAVPLILVHGWPGSFYEFDSRRRPSEPSRGRPGLPRRRPKSPPSSGRGFRPR